MRTSGSGPSADELAPGMRGSDRSAAFTQVEPGDEKKAADQTEMLEERVLGHEALRQLHFPELIGDEGGDQRETGEPQRAEPAVGPGQDERGSDELGDDRRAGSRGRERQPEVLRLGYRSVEVEKLVEAALDGGRAQPQQGDRADLRRRANPP